MMKKILAYVVGLVVIIAIIQHVINITVIKKPGLFKSRSIKESRENGAFIARYVITEIDSNVIDSLEKYGYEGKLNNFQFWVEKYSSHQPKYVFFYPRVYSNESAFNYKDPIIDLCDTRDSTWIKMWEGELPGVDFFLPDNYGPDRRIQSYQIEDNDLPEKLKLDVSFYWRKKTNKSVPLGTITLARAEVADNPKSESIWKSFHLLPIFKMMKGRSCKCCK